MTEGTLKRIQPDLVEQIEAYPGGSFSEKMVKWKNDVNTMSHDDVDDTIREALRDVLPELLRGRT